MTEKILGGILATFIVAAVGWAYRVESRIGDASLVSSIDALTVRIENLEKALMPVLVEHQVRLRMAEVATIEVDEDPAGRVEALSNVEDFMAEQRALDPRVLRKAHK